MAINLLSKIFIITLLDRFAEQKVILVILKRMSPRMLFFFVSAFFEVCISALVAAVLAAIWVFNSFFVSSSLRSDFLTTESLIFSAFWQIIPKIWSFCSYVILEDDCTVNDKSEFEKNVVADFSGHTWSVYRET